MARIVVPGLPHPVIQRENRCQRTFFRKDDVLVTAKPLLKLVPRWAKHLSGGPTEEAIGRLYHHEATGRPVGGERFLTRLEKSVGWLLRPQGPGRKRKTREQ
jgi:hypothetical protein